MAGGLYVQYGCGFSAPDGWLNFDASPTLRFERSIAGFLYSRNGQRFPSGVRYGDIVRGLPVPERSCRGLYCSHVLEHLALEDCDRALANTFRYLEPDGLFRLVVPDFTAYIDSYLQDSSERAALVFMESSALGRTRRPRGVAGLMREWLGNSAHLWMWDERSMAARLRDHGFVNIRRAAYGDSEDT
ncbi:MAG TPA: methyltransferase domain-containing protein, partial [Vicinamibacterales bacterium]|nr:methyltransferase domain-containing protein [Vicinamibacterales bacterium]